VNFSPEVSFFSLNLSCFGRYSGKKLVKTGNGSGFLTGNQLIFQKFQGFTRFVAKSGEIWPQETEMGFKNA
jgi:hypothetical protein